MKKKRLEIEAKFNDRIAAKFTVTHSSGETAELTLTKKIDPQLAALSMAGAGM